MVLGVSVEPHAHTHAPPTPTSPRHVSTRARALGRMSRRLAYARRPEREILLN